MTKRSLALFRIGKIYTVISVAINTSDYPRALSHAPDGMFYFTDLGDYFEFIDKKDKAKREAVALEILNSINSDNEWVDITGQMLDMLKLIDDKEVIASVVKEL